MDKPILLDLPDRLDTARLILQAPRTGLGGVVHDAIRESLDHLRPWMPWAHSPQSPAVTEEWCRKADADWITRADLPMVIFRRDGGFVGCAGLHPLNWSVPKFHIGYWCRASCQGHGYITEAVRALTDFAFGPVGAQRVEIRCDARNLASRRVAERAGYRLEAEFGNDDRAPDGNLRSTLIFALIAPSTPCPTATGQPPGAG